MVYVLVVWAFLTVVGLGHSLGVTYRTYRDLGVPVPYSLILSGLIGLPIFAMTGLGVMLVPQRTRQAGMCGVVVVLVSQRLVDLERGREYLRVKGVPEEMRAKVGV